MSPKKARNTLCIIQDGIDHHKYIRPGMDLTCCIVHGKFLLLAMSEPWVRKDSSWCTELTAHCLDRLGGDLWHCDLVLQADICARECNNRTTTRFSVAFAVKLQVGLFKDLSLNYVFSPS